MTKIPKHNNKILPIDVLIYSNPKTCGTTLCATLNNYNIRTYYTHDSIFFKNTDINNIFQGNDIELNDYIKMQINFRETNVYTKKFCIITIFRPIMERLISLFFQNYNIINNNQPNLDNLSIIELITYFNNNILNFNIDNSYLFDIFNINYKNIKCFTNYKLYNVNKNIDIIFLDFKNINNWVTILSSIFDINITKLISSNASVNKLYYNKMIKFKSNYFINNIIYKYLINYVDNCIYLNDSDKIEYLNKWKPYLNNSKTLIGKNNILFLQNDSNNLIINLIYKTNILSNYSKFINSIDSKKNNIYSFIYPNKEVIYKKYLPNYINILDIYNINYIDICNNMYYTPELFNLTDYYIYDTHINIKGLYKTFNYIMKIIDINYIYDKLSICKNNNILVGFGDLLWDINLLQNIKNNINYNVENENNYIWDNYELFYTNNLSNYLKYYTNLIIEFINYDNNIETLPNDTYIDWNVISNYIIISFNNNHINNSIILVFYDSYSTHLIPILMNYYKKCIFIKKILNKSYLALYNYNICINLQTFRFIVDL